MSRLAALRPDADYMVIEREDLADSELEGRDLGGVDVSLIFIDSAAGEGPALHRHPYPEVFVVLEGRSRFTVGEATLDAVAGEIVMVRSGVAHRFVNPGPGRLRQIDIHPRAEFVTEWLGA